MATILIALQLHVRTQTLLLATVRFLQRNGCHACLARTASSPHVHAWLHRQYIMRASCTLLPAVRAQLVVNDMLALACVYIKQVVNCRVTAGRIICLRLLTCVYRRLSIPE
jgi:hypothetical protein